MPPAKDGSEERSLNTTFQIGTKNGHVILMFSKPIDWLELPPEAARELARGLITRADIVSPKGS